MFMTLILTSFVLFAANTRTVGASTTITITASGEIVPPTALITTLDNITYVFNGNVQDTNLVVQRDNIVIDGQDYLLNGTNSGVGVDYRQETT